MVQQNATALRKADALPARRDPARDFARLPGFDYAGHALLREVRWRPHEPTGRGPRVLMLAILLLHILAVFVVRELMKAPPPVEDRREVMHVSLIEEVLPEPPAAIVHELPTLRVEAPQQGTATNAPAPMRRALSARLAAPAAAQSGEVDAVVATPQLPKLYNADGSLRVSAPLPVTTTAEPMAAGKAAARELLARGHNLVRCRPTRFASAYSPDESAGDEVARKYLSVVGLYNPHTAAATAGRKAEATAACDSDGF